MDVGIAIYVSVVCLSILFFICMVIYQNKRFRFESDLREIRYNSDTYFRNWKTVVHAYDKLKTQYEKFRSDIIISLEDQDNNLSNDEIPRP